VVGAGLGGLATAVALARQGNEVTVLEQAAALGEVCLILDIDSASWRTRLTWTAFDLGWCWYPDPPKLSQVTSKMGHWPLP